MLRRLFLCALAGLLLVAGQPTASHAAQSDNAQKTEKSEPPKKAAPQKIDRNNLTAEQVAETVVLVYGSREGLKQIRRSGVERGKITRFNAEGKTEEIDYQRAFKRGETFDKDKIRLDQRMPALEYSIIYNEGQFTGVLRGSTFKPRQQDVTTVMLDRTHGLDALLRYKENGASVKYVGKDNQKGLDLWILDLTDKESRATRYFISAKTGRVLWLEYEERAEGESASVKYRRSFHDYRNVQGTLVPYRSVLYAGDRQVEESRLMTMTYGVKLEDSVFQNPEAASLQP
ncbi:MAG TPA: hypothetical protein VEX60_12755 [Pyrinomonadaceae bacterium]|nr:hypothetical protein [Pyrinomonadaceae bacterium]